MITRTNQIRAWRWSKRCLYMKSRTCRDPMVVAFFPSLGRTTYPILTMFWSPIISLLMLWSAGANAQRVLSQPASASVSLGGTVKVSCALDRGASINDYIVSWYQRKSGSSPRYLLQYKSHTEKDHGSGVPPRFSASKDLSSNTGYLSIAGALAEDEADYYCVIWRTYVFGGGTSLLVLGQPIVHPSVSVFPPSQEEIKSKNKATLVCLMDGFYPRAIQVEWKANDGTISAGVETSTPVKQGDKYVASSYLALTRSEWEANKDYTCKVTHESKTIEKVVSPSSCS
uniref:Ig-like domain-containing protein n=1 Tax=Anolis carolinensis TaxID=28377 RepID=H9GS59_ANOCA